MRTYRIDIDASNDDRTIWQTMHTEVIDSDESAQDLAEITAEQHDVAVGDGWRVRVHLVDEDGDTDIVPLAEAGPGAATMGLAELAARIRALSSMPAAARATEAATLATATKATLAAMRRAAVYEATRDMTWEDAAASLGVSVSAINQLVTQHRAA